MGFGGAGDVTPVGSSSPGSSSAPVETVGQPAVDIVEDDVEDAAAPVGADEMPGAPAQPDSEQAAWNVSGVSLLATREPCRSGNNCDAAASWNARHMLLYIHPGERDWDPELCRAAWFCDVPGCALRHPWDDDGGGFPAKGKGGGGKGQRGGGKGKGRKGNKGRKPRSKVFRRFWYWKGPRPPPGGGDGDKGDGGAGSSSSVSVVSEGVAG